MLFGDDLRDKICTACKKSLLKDGLLNVIYEYDYWIHRKCRAEAGRQLANAMYLAKLYTLNQAIMEYRECREVL